MKPPPYCCFISCRRPRNAKFPAIFAGKKVKVKVESMPAQAFNAFPAFHKEGNCLPAQLKIAFRTKQKKTNRIETETGKTEGTRAEQKASIVSGWLPFARGKTP